MVKAAAMKTKPGPPKAKKTSPLKANKTVPLKAKEVTAPLTKKARAAKFIALKKSNDERFRKQSVQKRHAIKRWKTQENKRAVIALSNIPHGFFENPLKRYFRQFGVVENVKLVRSKKTGQSCGYAYIEFEHMVVAKLVAKHMNGYLTFGKIMKCKVVPPEVVTDKLFKGKNIRPDNCPKLNQRKGAIRKLNKRRTEKQIQSRVARLKSSYKEKIQKLQELGVNLPLQTLLGTQQQGEDAAGDKVMNGHHAPEDSASGGDDDNQASLALPGDACDVEVKEEDSDDLTQEQKEEMAAQREALAAQIMSHIESAKKGKTPKKSGAKTTPKSSKKMVLEVDESDDEVVLKTPPNVIKRYVKMGGESTPKATPETKVKTPKSEKVTPKAAKVKSTPKSTKVTPKSLKVTPKSKKVTPKLAKVTPKSEKTTPKSLKVTPKSAKTTPKSAKTTPKSAKMTTKAEKQTTPKLAKSPEMTPAEEKVTPKAKKTPKAVPKTPLGTKNATPKPNKTPTAGEATPEVVEALIIDEPKNTTGKTSPKAEKKTPKMKKATTNATPKQKKTLASLAQSTPKMEELTVEEIENTPKIGIKTPKKKKEAAVLKSLPVEDSQATPVSKKTPKVKKTDVVSENGVLSDEDPTPKKKKSAAVSPKGKKASPSPLTEKRVKAKMTPLKAKRKSLSKTEATTPGGDVTNVTFTSQATPKKKKGKTGQTPTLTPLVKEREQSEDMTLVTETTPGEHVTLTSQATPGKKKGKSGQTPTHTPQLTPGKRKQSEDMPQVVTEATPGKKGRVKRATPSWTVTSAPNSPEKIVTPKAASLKKTPNTTPGKRKSAVLEVIPNGSKSLTKKRKVPVAS